MKKQHFLILLLAFLVGAFAVQHYLRRDPADTTICIGAILPMTGDLGFFGQGDADALAIFQQENPNVRFLVHDSKASPKDAIAAVNALSDQGVKYYITSLSFIVNTVQPLIDERKSLNITLSMDPRAEIESRYCMRLYPTMHQEFDMLAHEVSNLNYKRVMVLYNNVESLQNAVEVHFRSKLPQGTTLQTLPYNGDVTDFRNLLLKAADFKPDVIRILDFGDKITTILRQIEEIPTLSQVPIISGVETLLTDYRKFPSSVLPRYRFTAPKLLLSRDNTVVAKYRTRYGKEPIFDAIFAYDIAQLLVRNIEKCGYANVEHVIDEITKQRTFHGAAADYTIDENGGVTPAIHWARISNSLITFD